MSDDRQILRVEDLKIYFGSGEDEVRAVDGVSLTSIEVKSWRWLERVGVEKVSVP